jgi:hypothetical protein
MGGIAGHISHPYENRQLTFHGLKDMLRRLAEGAIEVHEKADGINLYVTWDFETGDLRAARNKTNIKDGGMTRTQLEAKFAGRGVIKDAFIEAFDVLNAAFNSLTNQTRAGIFGSTGGVWFSLDILYPEARNLIQYDNKYVVFHRGGAVLFDWDGNPMEARMDRFFKMLELVMPHLNEAIQHTEWSIHGPSTLQLQPIDMNKLSQKIGGLDHALQQYGIKDGSTIEEYLRERLSATLSSLMFVPSHLREPLLGRLLGVRGSPTVKSLCKGQVPAVADHIKSCASRASKAIAVAMNPVEIVVHSISCALLGGCQSAFVKDGEAEVQRIRNEVEKAVGTLRASDDEKAGEVARRHMSRLGNAKKISTAVEGGVFSYRQNTYKITGNFGPANQIYGHVKYKLNPVRETAKDEVLTDYILGIVAG